jgi:hypothetical protein
MKKVLNYPANKKNATKKVTQTVVILIITVLMCQLSWSSCNDSSDSDGREAAVEFCNCYKSKSSSTCFEELKKKWSNYENSDFIDGFNEANTCGYKLVKTQTGN